MCIRPHRDAQAEERSPPFSHHAQRCLSRPTRSANSIAASQTPCASQPPTAHSLSPARVSVWQRRRCSAAQPWSRCPVSTHSVWRRSNTRTSVVREPPCKMRHGMVLREAFFPQSSLHSLSSEDAVPAVRRSSSLVRSVQSFAVSE